MEIGLLKCLFLMYFFFLIRFWKNFLGYDIIEIFIFFFKLIDIGKLYVYVFSLEIKDL